jgi:hypothetical protein
MAELGEEDRRNGSYARQLLMALGAIELCVPRTRRFSAGSIESTFTALEGQAVRHWFARQVGKSIVIVVRTGDARIHRP